MSYDPIKAAQVVAKLLRLSEAKALDAVKAVTLVYLCDRECITGWGLPILDENRVSMPHGPINFATYQHINGQVGPVPTGWKELLSNQANHMVGLTREAADGNLDLLSRAEIETIETVWGHFGHIDTWDLVLWTQQKENIPEWEYPGHLMRPIPLATIMEAVGIEDSAEACEAIEDNRRIDALFEEIRGH